MDRAIVIFFAAIFTNNIALVYFLGTCPLIAISNNIKNAWGMGVAVTFTLLVTAFFNWILHTYVIIPFHVEFLEFLVFIAVIAAAVQVLELIIERYVPALYISMGIFLPLITVNCAILGLSLFFVLRDYSFIETMSYALGSGIGWAMVIVAFAGIRTKLVFSNVPKALDGPGITMILAGIIALSFMGFAGVIKL